MKKLSFLAAALLLVSVSCKKETKKEETTVEEAVEQITKDLEVKKVKVALEAKSGSKTKGSAVFTQEDGVVTMVAVFDGMEAGEHAIHIHEKADCSAEDGTSTGGHWNPTFKQHGKWGDPNGYHKGDIGNFSADENGNGTITFATDEWCIGCGDESKDILGKGLIVHAGTDDYTTQPTGNAGGRVSCGGIIE